MKNSILILFPIVFNVCIIIVFSVLLFWRKKQSQYNYKFATISMIIIAVIYEYNVEVARHMKGQSLVKIGKKGNKTTMITNDSLQITLIVSHILIEILCSIKHLNAVKHHYKYHSNRSNKKAHWVMNHKILAFFYFATMFLILTLLSFLPTIVDVISKHECFELLDVSDTGKFFARHKMQLSSFFSIGCHIIALIAQTIILLSVDHKLLSVAQVETQKLLTDFASEEDLQLKIVQLYRNNDKNNESMNSVPIHQGPYFKNNADVKNFINYIRNNPEKVYKEIEEYNRKKQQKNYKILIQNSNILFKIWYFIKNIWYTYFIK